MVALSGCTVLDLTDETGALCVQLLASMGAVITRFSLDAEGQQRLRALALTADVLIETFSPGYLSSLTLGYKDLS